MKKYFFIAVLFLAGTVVAHAQLLPTFQLGLKGGLNFSSLKSDDGNWLDANSRTGYQAGIWARIGGAGIHFQPELYVTGKNTQAEFTNEGERVTADVKLTTLDLPLLIGTRVGLGPVGFRVQAGPIVSFLIDEGGLSEAFQQAGNFEGYKDQAVAITGGVGVDISKFRADLRYAHGLTNISQADSPDQKLGIFSVSVGLRLF